MPDGPDCWCHEYDGTAHYECYHHSPACICGEPEYIQCPGYLAALTGPGEGSP